MTRLVTPARVVVVCPSPSIDRTVPVGRLNVAGMTRARVAQVRAGGKGLNVVRVLRSLGTDATVVAPVGGETGVTLRRLAAADGLTARWVDGGAPTRVCTAVVEDGGRVSEINEPGQVTLAGWTALIEAAAWLSPGAVVAVSGSLPTVVAPTRHPGGPPVAEGLRDGPARPVGGADLMGELLAALAPASEIWVDTSGAGLEAAITRRSDDRAGPIIKVNGGEAATALGRPDGDPADLARAVAERTESPAVLTLGADGALVDAGGTAAWSARLDAPAEVVTRNPTGSGDAFLAGMLVRRTGGGTWPEALVTGIAAAVSNLAQPTAGVVDPERVGELETLVRVTGNGPSP